MSKKCALVVVAVLLLSLVSISMAAEEPKPAFPMVLEIEDFQLTNGIIVEHKDASNGKAVKATSFDFVASKTIKLTQLGFYEIIIYENAPAGNADAINLSVNDAGALRTYPNEATDIGKFAPCIKKYMFEVKVAGDYVVKVFTSNEMGALYDKLVINLIKAN